MQGRLIILLVSPSWLSLALVCLVAAALIGGANWTYFTYNPGVFDFFYGPQGVVTTLEQSPDVVHAITRGIAESPVVYGLGLAVLAILAAIVIFVGLRVLERGAHAIKSIRQEAPGSRHEVYQRVFLRIVVLVLWAAYAVFTAWVAVPYSLLVSRIGAEDIGTLPGMVTSVSAGLLLVATLHMHVIFARIFCLRPRVFGGAAAIEAATMGE